MTEISSHKDPEALTLTFIAEFNASAERLWQIWEDPRQLERWWGPPTWPATFDRHEFVAGGRSTYFMTGPAGEKARGWWEITSIEPTRRLEFEDGFADENGNPDAEMGSYHAVMTLEPSDGRTRMTVVTTFDDLAQLEKLDAMGMEEGMREAMGQIDSLLAEGVRA